VCRRNVVILKGSVQLRTRSAWAAPLTRAVNQDDTPDADLFRDEAPAPLGILTFLTLYHPRCTSNKDNFTYTRTNRRSGNNPQKFRNNQTPPQYQRYFCGNRHERFLDQPRKNKILWLLRVFMYEINCWLEITIL
jgi:hypothetical protein